jgi:hypothetical protein
VLSGRSREPVENDEVAQENLVAVEFVKRVNKEIQVDEKS